MRKFLFVSFVLMLAGLTTWAQRTVTGRVVDATGTPVAGASVQVKNTTVGTVTRADGTYSINVPANGQTLVISGADAVRQEVTIGAQSSVNVTLQASERTLQEVVVVGYGTQQRRSFTGSASKVDAQKIATLITPSVDKELAGRATGVQVTNTSGTVNAPARIRIRGINSLNQTNDPLIVVDGIPIITGNLSATTNSNAIADINPADIENIEVLKDGSATAIYGSRAAPGVILITTKKGRRGQLRVNYDGFYGFSNVAKQYSLLNAAQFVTIANEKLANTTPSQAPKAGVNAGGVNTDWQNEVLINNASVQNHNLSISGGSNKTTYFMSLNYSDQQGVIKSNWNKAYRIRANIDNEISKFIRIGNNITLSRQENTDQNTGGNSLGGAVAATLRLLPNVSPYDAANPTGFNINYPLNNIPNGPNSQGVDDNWFNVAFLLAKNKYYSEQYRIIDNAFIEISPVKGLKFRSQASWDMLNDYAFQAYDPRHGDGFSLNGYGYNADQNFVRYVWQNYFNYNLSLRSHNFFLTGGYEIQSTKTKFLTASGQGLSDLFFLKENIITGSLTASPSIGGSYSKSGFNSVFGRFNYDYKNRYFAQASIRRDGQSSLAPGNQYGNFPGFSAGWRPSEESFWKNNNFLSNWLSDVKLKGSYAKVGNALGGLPYLSTFASAPYGNLNGIAVNAIGNTDLQWETSKKYDAGIEIGLLKSRVNLTADWFLNDVDNLVLNVPTPISAGIPGNSIPQNIGSLQNKGIELAVDASIIRGKSFTWTINANFSSVHNKITKLYSIGGSPTSFINNGAYNIIKVGEPINNIWGYRYAGVNTANGYPMYYKADGKLVVHNIANGAYYFINDANDGTTATANQTSLISATTATAVTDKTKLGEATPTWFGAVTNSVSYKQFGLDFMFRYSGGNKIMNITRQEALLNQSFANNGTEVLQRWQKPGDVTNVPKLIYGQSNNINQVGLAISRFVEPGDYLRLQNVVLTYSLSPAVLQKFARGAIQSVRIYAQGQNLALWTKYSGADPDNISTLGIENPGLPPQIRTISFGLNIGF